VADTEDGAEAARRFFAEKKMSVLSFLGYSGSGYEDTAAMLEHAARALGEADPRTTLVNIGATPGGIGAVYELAKGLGFTTTGIVSTQAREQGVALSAHVDVVFVVQDASWGGFVKGTTRLSPTSQAIVEHSDLLVAIGGGDVARDELIAARQCGKPTRFIAADMNHAAARARAAKAGLPEPTDFSGPAAAALR
jgi:predicted Rossmann-fold nucleotide-binding protein